MDDEEIVLAFVEGFLRRAIETAEEMACGIYTVGFSVEKTKIGGTNS